MACFKRKVFYLPGFDPRGSRFYRQMLAEAVAPVAAMAAHGPGWRLSAQGSCCDYAILAWDDIVRAGWLRGGPALCAAMLVSYARMIARFDWRHAGDFSRGNWLAIYGPAALVLGAALVAGALAGAVAAVWLGAWGALVGALAGLGTALAAPLLFGGLHAMWLLRFVLFNDACAAGQAPPALAPRLDAFADALAAALAEPADEVLLVAHSNGTVLAIEVVARLIARLGALPGHFALVTLGGCLQMASLRRDASGFHQAARQVAASDLRWLDLSAPPDGACIRLGEPFAGLCAAPAGLVRLSPRWHVYADPATYAARRADRFAIHFDYLRRLARPSPLDFPALLLAPRALAASIAAFRADNGLADG